ncbi:hypothetical protein TEA_006342 [Camellia sinensis var. sinensis]|uniref:Sugar phosphate transporter domain-containing protein n=1 Tax=Camellia sinensis var. sinensis TaxID=542762 RepID=A0A4S4DS36_CAMSN|nr:hypothetical protein TEA_006342 [Camellia sinensis var. sinensis]
MSRECPVIKKESAQNWPDQSTAQSTSLCDCVVVVCLLLVALLGLRGLSSGCWVSNYLIWVGFVEKLERIDDGGEYFVSVERDSIHSRHSSMVGLQRYRNHHEQMDLSAIGAYLVIKVLKLKPLITVEPEDRWRRIFPMSFVFCINIVLGNVSLRYIPVSFMQTIKSFTPATTVILQWLVWRKHFDSRIWASLVPIVGGILLTSITELSFNMFGFCAALFGCLATSTKTILAESLLHGYKFDRPSPIPLWNATMIVLTLESVIPVNMYYMAPYATMILAVPALLLEGAGIMLWFQTHTSLLSPLIIIFGSGVLAFCLNFSIFYVIHSTTAVTFNVAGNLKVAVAVTCSWLIFRNPISALNAFGCAVTLLGCTFYGYVRHKLSQQAPGTPRTPRTPRNLKELIPLVNDKLDDKI